MDVLGVERLQDTQNQQQMALERSKALTDVMNKTQMMRFYRDELRLKAKAQEDEVAKAKMLQDVSNVELGLKAFEAAIKAAESQGPEAAQQTLIMFQKMYPQIMPSIMENGLGDMFSKFQMGGDEQMKRAAAQALTGQLGNGQSRAGAVGGGYILPTIKTEIGDFVNPELEAAVTGAKSRATKAAESGYNASVGENLVSNLERAWTDAFSGNPERGVALQEAPGNLLGAVSQSSPKITTYIATRKATLSMLVRALGEKGNLSDKDVARIEKALPTLWDSKEVASMKFQSLRDIINGIAAKQGGTPSRAPVNNANVDAAYERYLQIVGGR